MDELIVEDNDSMAAALIASVTSAGHVATRVSRGEDALLIHRKHELVLLDPGLPDLDGLDVLRKLRRVTPCPILILTARDDERSVVLGLRSVAERHARLVLGRLDIDPDHRVAAIDGHPVALTATEFDLLALLARHAGSVVTREQILYALWGDAFLATSRSLDVHLTGLRAKLQLPGFIVNVRGVGYRIRADGT